jgi:signal transduction histidine kinase
MRFRTKLFAPLILLGLALLVSLGALLFLARSISLSLAVIESVRVRQLVAGQMQATLRDAEAALYRYHLEGEPGFAAQFQKQIDNFKGDVERYAELSVSEEQRGWAAQLAGAEADARRLGHDLIAVHDRQINDLQAILQRQAQLADLLLVEVQANRTADIPYQQTVEGMSEAARAMLTAVTAYLAAPDEAARVKFTEAAIQFQQQAGLFAQLARTATERQWAAQIEAQFRDLQTLGSQLISERDLQQSLFARFIAIAFTAGQATVVEKIQPWEARQLIEAQQTLSQAVAFAIVVSLLAPLAMTALAGGFAIRLARRMDANIRALLRGAERVTAGDLTQPVDILGRDELKSLADSFNTMMTDLATRERRLRARLAELETLRQVSLQLTRTLDPEQVLDTVTASALQLAEATDVHIFTCEAGALTLAASAGQPQAALPAPPRPESIVGVVASTGQLQVINGASRPLYNASRPTHWNPPSMAGFPLKLGEQVLGVLYVASDARRVFTAEDVRILNLLADQAAVALGNARLYRDLAERQARVQALMQKMSQIQDEERRLIGLDLHDGLTQMVISANMHLNALGAFSVDRLDAPARQELRASHDLIQRAIEEARRVIGELRPTVVEDFGLAEGLRQYVAEVCAAENWRAETHIQLDGIGLNAPAEAALFRIAQEALSNIRKHSHTDTIRVELRSEAGALQLRVQDWGRGFDLAALASERDRLGLVSMHERAKMINGVCEITSRPGEGVTVTVRVPLATLARRDGE